MTDIIVQDQIALTSNERTELEQLEGVIERGKKTFVEVGNALMEIRERRLYRETHATFETYTQERWDFSASRARQLIGAALVVASLPEVVTGVTPPITEAHARPLAALAPDLRERVWREAVHSAPDGKVTSTHVQAVVDKTLGKAGRFDRKLVYGVDNGNRIVYLPGYVKGNIPYSDGRFRNLMWIDGEELNQKRGFDAYELKEIPEIPALPEGLVNGFWLDRDQGQLFPLSDDWRPYRLRKFAKIDKWNAEDIWRTVTDKEIRGYEICAPLIWQDPPWLEQSRFQPGAEAWCPKCGNVGKTWALARYESWLPHPEKQQWLCRSGHWIPDADVALYEKPEPAAAPPNTDVVAPANELRQLLDYDNSEDQVLDELCDAGDLLNHLVTMPELVARAVAPERVREYNADMDDGPIDGETLRQVWLILAALDLQRRMELSQRYSGVLAYFQFMPGWFYAVDQTAKIIYGQADAEANLCERLFPECIAVKGSSLIEDREIYLKGHYRLVIEIVERK